MAYDQNNVFAKILRGEIPNHTVYEDAQTLAFMDVMPQAEGHVLVIPKYPAQNIFELPAEQLQSLIVVTRRIAIAAQKAFSADGAMLIQFNGEAAGQTVFHVHFHVVPRYHGQSLREHGRSMAEHAVLASHAQMLRQAL